MPNEAKRDPLKRKRPSLTKAGRRAARFRTLRKRDGDLCWICLKPMDFETRDMPLSVTFDHILELSKGGADNQSNIKLAHKSCNRERSKP